MKLFRFGQIDEEKPGVLLSDGSKLDVSAFGEDYDESFFGSGGLQRLKDWLSLNKRNCRRVDDAVRIAAPICRPSKIICIGLNYAGHAKESGMEPPEEPVIFFKATSSISGPYDDVIIPKGSEKTDWEVELAFVIEKRASYVPASSAMDYVAGYLLHNDLSERNYQLERGGQWVKGKSCDTFAPLGPWLVTRDEIQDPHKLDLWLKLNGEIMQNSNTSDLIFNIPHLVHYLSSFMTLLPGDVISTGTPAGVGLGLDPPMYLKEGDVMELGIQALGVARQKTIRYE